MHDYIVDSFAGILTKKDVIDLFWALTWYYKGNRSEAARRIGVTGAATYGWERANYIKFSTKKKVLAANLESNFLDTVEFLFKRTSERNTDILRTVLMTLYSEALQTESVSLFQDLISRFYAIKMNYRGVIRDNLEDEVSEMEFTLEQKAEDIGVSIPQRQVNDLTTQQFISMLPLIVMEYQKHTTTPNIAAENLNLPIEETQSIWSAFKLIQPTQRLRRASSEGVWFEDVYTYLRAGAISSANFEQCGLKEVTFLRPYPEALGGLAGFFGGDLMDTEREGLIYRANEKIPEANENQLAT